MAYVTTTEMLNDAQKNHYAIGAFNVENIEMIKAVIEAAQELYSPVILQTTPSTVKYIRLDEFYIIVKNIADHVCIPVVLHLDHGNDRALAIDAYHAGYSSIMIDASKKSIQENIRITKEIKDICILGEIPVEAELGKVSGKEDDHESGDIGYTDVNEAITFTKNSGADTLAIAIGTAHGFYKGIPKLDIERLKNIRNSIHVPLVLHGASGVPDEMVKEAIQCGICKVNYATELRVAYTKAIRETLLSDDHMIDPKVYGKNARQAVKELVKHKIEVCGSANRVK